MKDGGKCSCVCHKMTGIFVILFGLVFLLGALGVMSPQTVAVTWPVLVILAGGKMLMKGFCKCCDEA